MAYCAIHLSALELKSNVHPMSNGIWNSEAQPDLQLEISGKELAVFETQRPGET